MFSDMVALMRVMHSKCESGPVDSHNKYYVQLVCDGCVASTQTHSPKRWVVSLALSKRKSDKSNLFYTKLTDNIIEMKEMPFLLLLFHFSATQISTLQSAHMAIYYALLFLNADSNLYDVCTMRCGAGILNKNQTSKSFLISWNICWLRTAISILFFLRITIHHFMEKLEQSNDT